MGTVNYKTSDIITIGYRPVDAWDLEHDDYFMKEARKQSEEYGDSIDDIILAEIENYTEDDQIRAQEALDKYSFEFFTVSIEPGYYEGFSIDITDNLPGEFYDDDEREHALKDVENLYSLLHELITDVCLCEVWPGWCTTYQDQAHSLRAIRKAHRELIAEINDTPNEGRSEEE